MPVSSSKKFAMLKDAKKEKEMKEEEEKVKEKRAKEWYANNPIPEGENVVSVQSVHKINRQI